jgi:hypothetical protein
MKRFISTVAVLAVLVMSGQAFANGSIHHNTFGGDGGNGGNASADSNNTNVNVNTQGQHQGQSQTGINVQGQKQSADNKGNSQSVNIAGPNSLPMNTGVAVAPGLTSVGTFACLGSWSVALGGPGAAVGGGSTKRDPGCEHARDASILMGWYFSTGHEQFRDAAIRLLAMNEDTHDALFPAAKAIKAAKKAQPAPAASVPSVQTN